MYYKNFATPKANHVRFKLKKVNPTSSQKTSPEHYSIDQSKIPTYLTISNLEFLRNIDNLLDIESDTNYETRKSHSEIANTVGAIATAIKDIGTESAIKDSRQLISEFLEISNAKTKYYHDNPNLFFDHYEKCLSTYFNIRTLVNSAFKTDRKHYHSLGKSFVNNLTESHGQLENFNNTKSVTIQGRVLSKAHGGNDYFGEDERATHGYHDIPVYILYQLSYLLLHPQAIFSSIDKHTGRVSYMFVLPTTYYSTNEERTMPVVAILSYDKETQSMRINSVYGMYDDISTTDNYTIKLLGATDEFLQNYPRHAPYRNELYRLTYCN